ncbi:aspartate racemase [Pannonibacter phragmitetus]|uniref:Aspartate racemase n=1 Tax=Pannonibacter phragmitetus TaxID=121719 RepID=A0A378ZYT8_9HYPH|nr:aspartate/glutamate racemase family protein [Pannonibacter phragmitetus]SUB02238.1 aspartate racemase [Pannonibacter phragmitetus]
MNQRSYTLGIITGSGPEAGLDMWAKILRHTQDMMGCSFRGDLDAPRLVAVSEPELGLSMDLRENEDAVWAAMERAVRQIAPQVDAFAIACNTLNWFAPKIEVLLAKMGVSARLVSFQSVVASEIRRSGSGRVGLLGAAPVVALDEYSAYATLTPVFDLETPVEPQALQGLIHDVKRLGSMDASLAPRLEEIILSMEAQTVLLACTELPLIARPVQGKTLIDVTDAVAAALAGLALEHHRAAA